MIYTDAALRAYLAGQMDEGAASGLEAAIAADAALEARVIALDDVAQDVSRAFMMLTPPPMAKPPVREGAAFLRLAPFAATLAAGLFAGWMLAQSPKDEEAWVMAVADYQVLYQPETVAVLSHDPDAVRTQLERSGSAIGADLVRLADLTLEDRPLLRAQILGLDGQQIIQMVFQLPDGTPAALCVTQAGGTAIEGSELKLSGLSANRWQESGLDILLIADVDAPRMRALADAARAEFRGL